MTTQWQDDANAFNKRSLAETDYVYCWVDGIHLKVRLDQDKVCLVVMIGVRGDGTKELIALADGFRESAQSWADLLREGRRRGMAAPVLAIGDGALGFCKAIRAVFPATREQRCWFHAGGNVLAALPKSAHPGAKAALAEIDNAEERTTHLRRPRHSRTSTAPRGPRRSPRSPSTSTCCSPIYDYPAEHWVPLRTTNPIESTFATVRFATAGHQGPGLASRRGGDGVQAHRVRSTPLARRERPTPGRPGTRRREVRQRQAHRAPRRIKR